MSFRTAWLWWGPLLSPLYIFVSSPSQGTLSIGLSQSAQSLADRKCKKVFLPAHQVPMGKASGLSRIPELDFPGSYLRSVSGVLPREGGLPFDLAAELPTAFPQLALTAPHSPAFTPLGLSLGASRPKCPPALWTESDQRPCCYFQSCSCSGPCGRREKCHPDKDTEHKGVKNQRVTFGNI